MEKRSQGKCGGRKPSISKKDGNFIRQKIKRVENIPNSPSFISKEKYYELAKEIRAREDDVRHFDIGAHKTPQKKARTDAANSRESLAILDHKPVSKLREYWESLMSVDLTVPPTSSLPLKGSRVGPASTLPTEKCTDFPLPPLAENEVHSFDPTLHCTDGLPPPPSPPSDFSVLIVPSSTETVNVHDSLNHNSSPKLLRPPENERDNFLSKSVDCIDIVASSEKIAAEPTYPNSAQHSYYQRQRPGVLRNWPNTSNLVSEADGSLTLLSTLPRQRSVTFEPKKGSAPGDTETETDACGSGGAGSVYDQLSQGSEESNDTMHRPRAGVTDIPANIPVYGSDSDSDAATNILESAARLANSADRLRRRSQSSSRIEAPHQSSSHSESDDGDDKVPASEPEALTTCHIGRRRKSSCRRTCSRGSSNASHRLSRDAAALLDLDIQLTPLRPKSTRADELCDVLAARRDDRIREITGLLEHEKRLIIETSSALQSSPADGVHNAAPDAPSHFKFRKILLLACQRQQALMEELSLLHRGSPVLQPPIRGEPLRARFIIDSIRLALKPEAPYSKIGLPSGFAVIGQGETALSTPFDAPSPITGLWPIKYHLIAVLKCIGEGRIYHTKTVTLMRLADLPVGCARSAAFVDLPANLEIVPLRPDFLISLEVYCMKVGDVNRENVDLSDDVGIVDSNLSSSTPLRRRNLRAHSPEATPKRCGFHLPSSLLLSARRLKNSRAVTSIGTRTPKPGKPSKITTLDRTKRPEFASAFTMLSSVSLRHYDGLLFGQMPPSSSVSSLNSDTNTNPTGMPLVLESLPRSCPLAGPLGLNRSSVRLESAVMKRGFLTIFEEATGMGVWQRRWCKLRGDRLLLWNYPEDEVRRDAPVGIVDLRHVITPWAVPAPPKICVRSNTIYMRSLVSVSPKWISSATDGSSSTLTHKTTSLLFHASSDYRWLEQKHLLCADTVHERSSWIDTLNRCLDALQSWMPEHFACLQRYDARLDFKKPVAASLASSLTRSQVAENKQPRTPSS